MKYIGKFNEVVSTAPLSDNRIADTDSSGVFIYHYLSRNYSQSWIPPIKTG